MELKMLDAMLDDATFEEFKWDILHSLFIKGKSLYLFTVLKILRTWESDFYKKIENTHFCFSFYQRLRFHLFTKICTLSINHR